MRARTLTLLLSSLTLWCTQALAQQPDARQPVGTTPPQATQPAASLQATQHPRYSANGLYNLANTYARAGKPGLAVLNYERAALMAPADPDIAANLNFVRAAAHVPPEPHTRFTDFAQTINPTTAAWLGVLGIALVGSALVAKRITKRLRWLRPVGSLLGIALIAVTVSNAILLWPRMHQAVILVNQTPARVTPVPMGDAAFELREAETVTMTAEHEDFVLIRTRAGQSGWVARSNLGAVVP